MARPWYRLSALNVYRDRSSMGANPALNSSLQAAIEKSRFFLLLLSPAALTSSWVCDEVTYWFSLERKDRLIIAVIEGEPIRYSASPENRVVTPSDLAAQLALAFKMEPKWVDLRSWPAWSPLDLKHADFSQAVAEIASPVHGLSPEELKGLSRARRRHFRILTASIGALVLALAWWGYNAQRTAAARHLAMDARKILMHAQDLQRDISASKIEEAAELIQKSLGMRQNQDTQDLAEQLAPLLPQQRFHHGSPVVAAEVTSDGRLLAVGGADGTVSIWNWQDESELMRFQYGNRIRQLAWNREGDTLAIRDDACALRIWQRETGKHYEIASPLQRPTRNESEAALSRFDEAITKAMQSGSDPPIELRMLPDQTLRPQNYVNCAASDPRSIQKMAWSPRLAAPLLALMDRDGILRLWDARSETFILEQDSRNGQVSNSLNLEGSWIRSYAWSPDGTYFAVGTQNGSVLIFSTQPSHEVTHISHDGPVLMMSWSADGEWLASAAPSRKVKFWRRSTLALQSIARGAPQRSGTVELSWHPAKSMIAIRRYSGTVLVVDARSGRMIFMPSTDAGRIMDDIFLMQWAPAGRFFATASSAGSIDGSLASTDKTVVDVWTDRGTRVRRWLFDERVSALAWGQYNEGLLLAIGTVSGQLRVIDHDTELDVTEVQYSGRVEKMLWNTQSQVLGVVTQHHSLFSPKLERPKQRFFRWDRQKKQHWAAAHNDEGYDMFFHPQNNTFVTSGVDGIIRVWGRGIPLAERLSNPKRLKDQYY